MTTDRTETAETGAAPDAVAKKPTPLTDAFEREHRGVDAHTAAYAACEFARTLELALSAAEQRAEGMRKDFERQLSVRMPDPHGSDLVCPVCHERDFDAEGLAMHFTHDRCYGAAIASGAREAGMIRRRFIAAANSERCHAVVKLRDGSTADCGRKAKSTRLCRQHEKAAGCDCQCPEPESGAKLVSNECPIHNHLPAKATHA